MIEQQKVNPRYSPVSVHNMSAHFEEECQLSCTKCIFLWRFDSLRNEFFAFFDSVQMILLLQQLAF